MFKVFDVDGSGSIDRDEIAVFINKIALLEDDSPAKSSIGIEHKKKEDMSINLSSDSIDSHSLTSSDDDLSKSDKKVKPGSFKVKKKDGELSKKDD